MAERGEWSLQKLGPLTGLGVVVSAVLVLFIQNQTNPLATRLESVQTSINGIGAQLGAFTSWRAEVDKALNANVGDDQRSITDRADLSRRLDRLNEEVAKLDETVVANSSALTEVETQFKADELIAAQRESNAEQWKGIFFRELFGKPLPQRGPVVPGIARDPGRGSSP